MIYFFEKDGQFRQLEIYPERPYTLACIDATGAYSDRAIRVRNRFERRWDEVQSELREAGWSGPFGRDGRA